MLKLFKLITIGSLYTLINLAPFIYIIQSNKLFALNYIAIFLFGKKLLKSISDIPIGLALHRFGYKKGLIFSVTLKLLAVNTFLVLYHKYNNNLTYIISISIIFLITEVVCDLIFNWKFEINLYNAVKQSKIEKYYIKVVNTYYIILNAIEIISLLFANTVYKTIIEQRNIVLCIYIVLTMLVTYVAYATPLDNDHHKNNYHFRSEKISNIMILFAKNKILYYNIILSVTIVVSYTLRTIMIAQVDKNFQHLVSMNTICAICIFFGCIYSIVVKQNKIIYIVEHYFINILRVILLLLTISVYFCHTITLILIFMACLMYPAIQGCCEFRVDSLSTQNTRFAASSVGSTIYNTLAFITLLPLSVNAIQKQNNYIMMVVYFALFLIINIAYRKIKK